MGELLGEALDEPLEGPLYALSDEVVRGLLYLCLHDGAILKTMRMKEGSSVCIQERALTATGQF